jgi:hypothetical protein
MGEDGSMKLKGREVPVDEWGAFPPYHRGIFARCTFLECIIAGSIGPSRSSDSHRWPRDSINLVIPCCNLLHCFVPTYSNARQACIMLLPLLVLHVQTDSKKQIPVPRP